MNGAAPIETAERIDAAAHLIASGRHAEAETLVRAILEREPGNPDAINALASIALAQRDSKRAYDILAPACTAYPDHARLMANLGLAHVMLGRPQEAVACLERAVAIAPREIEFHLSLAQYLVAAGDSTRALTELEAALREDPDNVGALSRLGVVAMGNGDWARAEAVWRRAVAIDPKNADVLYNLSVLCGSTNRREESALFAERAHLWAPLDIAKRVQFARARANIGDFQAAATACKNVLMVAPENLPATELFARLTLMRGAVPAGLEQLSYFVRKHPKDTAAILALAGALRFVGRMPQALTFVDQALAIDPGHAFGQRLRNDLLLTLGRFAEVWPAPAETPAAVRSVVAPKGTPPVEALLFGRFLDALHPDGVTLTSEADAMTTALLKRIEGVRLVREAETNPEPILLQGAPAALGLTRETLTRAERFLRPDPAQSERWRRAFDDLPRPLVGVDWDQYAPGARAAAIIPIAAGRGTVVSLALDPERRQLEDWPSVIDAGASIRGADDLIAAVARLDAVVATDGLPLHVAGALGVPGVAVVACGYPWYFAAEGDRSLWYASLRVARQGSLASWDDAAAKAFGLLAEMLSASSSEGAKS